MPMIVFHHQNAVAQVLGNKASRLAQAEQAGFMVPEWFVVTDAAFCTGADSEFTLDSRAVKRIQKALRRLNPDSGLLAVRSSGVAEDSAEHSFAGQYDTFLNVRPEDVLQKIIKVRQSAYSQRAMVYREQLFGASVTSPPAVIVQRMIPAHYAGVAFSANPVSGQSNEILVSAVSGLGDKLVDGSHNGKTWQVMPAEKTQNTPQQHSYRIKTVASDSEQSLEVALANQQISAIADLAQQLEQLFGHPQDVEWAIHGDTLYLLQSRDITTLPSRLENSDDLTVWDNSNIVESYGGITLPLTFSVARGAYREAYKNLCRVGRVPRSIRQANEDLFEQMLGLIQGRVYYNLLNWYRLLALIPGFGSNHRYMEQMMGVTEGIPANLLPRPAAQNLPQQLFLQQLKTAYGYAKICGSLFYRYLFHRRRVKAFHKKIDHLLATANGQAMNLQKLANFYSRLQQQVLTSWEPPLTNDLFCMMFHGLLRRLCEQWLPPELHGAHNNLVAGEAGIISLEPARRMTEMAETAGKYPGLAATLRNDSRAAIEQRILSCPGFAAQLQRYLDEFGDRCLEELKLESLSLAADPTPLFRAIGALAVTSSNKSAPVNTSEQPVPLSHEKQIRKVLGPFSWRRIIFFWVLKKTREFIRHRENLRFERTRVYGSVRRLFLTMGQQLQNIGALDNQRDIFYLEDRELLDFIRGTAATSQLSDIADIRKVEYSDYQNAVELPRRFLTRGPAQRPESMQELPRHDDNHNIENDSADRLQGVGASAGVVRGTVNIVSDPKTAVINPGDILVAERTDPGWVTLFPLAAGLIIERGSLLSHSAIVARELGLPTVVSAVGAFRKLQPGELVEVDGNSGLVRRLDSQGRAA